MSKKVLLVTGANGYIGSHLVKALCDRPQNFRVVATDINNDHIDRRAHYIKYNFLEVTKEDNLHTFFQEPDICVHLAWRDGFNHNSYAHIQDLPYHFCFMKNLVDNGLEHLAVAGSFREYGNHEGKASEDVRSIPENFYALAKSALKDALTIYLKDKDVCLQWLRPFTVYGDEWLNNSLMSKILVWEKEGKSSFPFTDGNEEYDYIYINELTKQIIAIISQTEISGVIDCCSGHPTKLKVKIEEFLKENHLKIQPQYGTFPSRSYDSKVIYGDNTKIQKILELQKQSCDTIL